MVLLQPVSRFFDLSNPIKLQLDASKSGLRTCILQYGNPITIAYASIRSLTQVEEHCAQTEEELLTVVFVCEGFNRHVFCRSVDGESDHREPLVSILISSSPRLQRLLLRFQKCERLFCCFLISEQQLLCFQQLFVDLMCSNYIAFYSNYF